MWWQLEFTDHLLHLLSMAPYRICICFFFVYHSGFLFGNETQLPDNLNLLDDPGSLLRPVRFDHMNYWYLKRDPPLPTFTPTQPLSKSPERSANQIWLVLLDWSPQNTAWNPSNPKINAALSNHVKDPAGCCINMDTTMGCRLAPCAHTAGNKTVGLEQLLHHGLNVISGAFPFWQEDLRKGTKDFFLEKT